MCKRPLLLIFAVAGLTASAISQEIVIGPTNGRAQTSNHVSRPAAAATTPVDSQKPALQDRKATSRPAKRAPAKPLAAKLKAAPVQSKPPVSTEPELAKSAAPELIAAPKKLPVRPDWAMADGRDVHSLQTEIASALARDPKLSGSSIQVNVDDGSVTLEGRAGPQEHLQAQRLAQSYAWNRKLVDHIEVVRTVSAQK